MRIENGYYIWNKGVRNKLGNFFQTNEFDCQCNYEDCVEQRISVDLVHRLDLVRSQAKSPLYITSGFRCSKHQMDLRNTLGKHTIVASKLSQHELGNAADVSPRLITIPKLRNIIETFFDTIGLAKTFLHVDTRPKKEDGSKRIWNY